MNKGGETIFAGISNKYIKDTLKTYHGRVLEIHKKIFELYRYAEQADELLKEVSYRSVNLETMSGGKTSGKQDLTDVLFRHESLSRERCIEIKTEIWELTEELETIDRIWCCYTSLQGEAARYIKELYVEKQPYKAVEKNSGYTHKNFETIRANAIKDIQHLYHSKLSNRAIITFRQYEKRKQEQSSKGKYKQIQMKLE